MSLYLGGIGRFKSIEDLLDLLLYGGKEGGGSFSEVLVEMLLAVTVGSEGL